MWAPSLSTELGGLGLGLVEHGLVSERLGRSPLGHYVFGCQAPDAGNMEILHKFGTPEQQETWLGPLARGEIRSCFSMTEPENPGSNPTMLSCRAVRDGDDYVIDGHKWFTTAADGAAFAIVMAVTNPDASPHARASMIIVPTSAPGFERVRNIKIMGEEGAGWGSHSEIRYTGVRVPVTNRLGGEGLGFAIAQERLGPGRIHHCMRWIGICERVFDTTCRHITRRKISEDQTLGSRQIAQAWIAEARVEIDAARLLVLHAAWRIETALCSTSWPAGFALVASPDARALIDFLGRERSLLFVQGPLPLASMPPLGSLLEPAQKLLEHSREGDVERMRVAYDDDGKPWVQEHRVVKLNAWAALIVTMQAPAALAEVTSAAAEELTSSIVSLQD